MHSPDATWPLSDLTPIAEVQFSEWRMMQGRIRNALVRNGIATLGNVANCTEAELLRMHGFGPIALKHVKDVLAAHGLSLGVKPNPTTRRPRRDRNYWQALVAAEKAKREGRKSGGQG
jgi:hypothetical protein